MKCGNCFWLTLNSAAGSDKVCCCKESENYNKVLKKDEIWTTGCDCGESQEAYDYRTMTPWGYASKYYG